ncbi:hypothetical protein COCON_G00215400 [Conger conger]|uniref:Uncharacterized protein n=1 Tax=Conger conger TaxID=82655 RepID=A0A9Q1HPB5_CONCO|nr:hypothetical protein COCON_G00215400 [Conger conger]
MGPTLQCWTVVHKEAHAWCLPKRSEDHFPCKACANVQIRKRQSSQFSSTSVRCSYKRLTVLARAVLSIDGISTNRDWRGDPLWNLTIISVNKCPDAGGTIESEHTLQDHQRSFSLPSSDGTS